MSSSTQSEQYPVAPSVLDAHHYRDQKQFEREVSRIFHDTWLRAFPSADLQEPRDFVVWDKVGQSVVVTRTEEGDVRAWHNVCQHRGARLVRESGHCGTGIFKCPWHGFAYGLDGVVEAVPLREAFDEEEIEGLRAPAVRCREWGGWVWLHLGSPEEDLTDYLGEIGQELDWYGLDDYEVQFRRTERLGGNWKIVMDAFLETWHVPFTHKDTLARVVQWRDAALRIPTPHSWMTIPLRGFSDRKGPDAGHHESQICHYLTFPNTIFSCFPTHLQTWSAWPVNVDETVLEVVQMRGATPQSMTEEEWLAQNERDWEHFQHVLAEDVEVIDDTAAVSASLGYTRNMFNRAEGRLTAFHQEINSRVGVES